MFARIFFDGVSNGDLDPVSVADDIYEVLTGETDFNNLTVGEPSDFGEIISTDPSGWEKVSRDDTSESDYVFYIMRSLCGGSATRYKYVIMVLRKSQGTLSWAAADAVSPTNPTTRLYHTLSSQEFDAKQSNNNNYQTFSITAAYYFYIAANDSFIFLIPGHGTRNAVFIPERTRMSNVSWDTPDSDFCPSYVYGSSNCSAYYPNQYSYNMPIPDPYTDVVGSYRLSASSDALEYTGENGIGLRVGYKTWYALKLGNARLTLTDGSTPLSTVRGKMVSGIIELSLLRQNVYVYPIDPDGAPTDIPGQKFTEVTDGVSTDYICLAFQWGTTTSYPIYIKVR